MGEGWLIWCEGLLYECSINNVESRSRAEKLFNSDEVRSAAMRSGSDALLRERVMYQANQAYIGYHELPNSYLPKDSV